MGRRKKMSAAQPFPPTLTSVEAELGPAREWAGRCYEIATACVERGFVEGVAVYGHWLGEVNPRSYFRKLNRPLPFFQHGWVNVRGDASLIFDPTRWAFTGEEPFLYFGPNRGEYDEGGNEWRRAMRAPCPPFEDEGDLHVITRSMLDGDAWTHVEKMLGPDYLIEFGDLEPGTITGGQLFWLANASFDELQPFAREIYTVVERLGEAAAIPIDNYRRAMRGQG